MSRSLLLRLGMSCLPFVYLVACNDNTGPKGGGKKTVAPTQCNTEWTPGWTANGLTMTVSRPPCPMPVHAAQSQVTYAAQVNATSNITFDAYGDVLSEADGQALNWFDASVIASSSYNYFVLQGDGSYVAEISMTGDPGIFPDPNDPTYTNLLDSLDVKANFMGQNGIAEGWKILPGRIDPNNPDILGPNGSIGVASGHVYTWESYPSWDTTAYNYKWLIDGQEIGGATGATYATSLATGTHTVSNVTILADNSRDSVSVTVKAFNVSISGPTNVRPMDTCTWSGTASGGTSPYNYSWSANGTYVNGQTFTYTNSSLDGGAFSVQLTVTDASGTQATVTQNVTVHNSALLCRS